MMVDPEIKDLQIATARAYAIAERLAHELESTVAELLDRVRPDAFEADTAGNDAPTGRRRA